MATDAARLMGLGLSAPVAESLLVFLGVSNPVGWLIGGAVAAVVVISNWDAIISKTDEIISILGHGNEHLAMLAEVNDAANKITNRIKKKGSKTQVDLGKFNRPGQSGRKRNDDDEDYEIDKDRDGHKGSKWKLFKRGTRVASLDGDGNIVGK